MICLCDRAKSCSRCFSTPTTGLGWSPSYAVQFLDIFQSTLFLIFILCLIYKFKLWSTFPLPWQKPSLSYSFFLLCCLFSSICILYILFHTYTPFYKYLCIFLLWEIRISCEYFLFCCLSVCFYITHLL